MPPSGIFSLRQKKGMGKSVNEKQHGSPFEGKGYSERIERKTGDPPINRGKNDKIAPRSKIGSNRVTSNFYRRKNRLVFVGGSKDRWSALQRRIWRERERRERKKIPHVRPHRLVPSGEKLRWEHEEEEEKRREIPPTSTTTVAVRVLVIVHGWPLE